MSEPPKRRWFLFKAVVLLVAVAAAFCSGFNAAYFAWVTATPVSEATKELARYYRNIWSGAFVISSIAAIALIASMIRHYKKNP